MTNSQLKLMYITDKEFLRSIRPALWRHLQEQFDAIFTSLNISVPAKDDDCDEDFYAALSEAFGIVEVSDANLSFIEILEGLELCAGGTRHEEFSATLQDMAENNNIEDRFLKKHHFPAGSQLSVPELAILLMTDSSTQSRFRSFKTFISTEKTAFFSFDCFPKKKGKVIEMTAPSAEKRLSLATRFKTDYKEALKLQDYCVIEMVTRPVPKFDNEENPETEIEEDTEHDPEGKNEWWFSISRSNRPIITASVEGEKVKSVSLVPPTTEVVVVNPVTKQIRTNCLSKARTRIYLEEFAHLVCPKVEIETKEASTFTFAPLEKKDWEELFVTHGITGLMHARLRMVKCKAGNGYFTNTFKTELPSRCLATYSSQQADSDKLRFSAIVRAQLQFSFSGESDKPTLVNILGPNLISIKKKHREAQVMQWLQKTGMANFLKQTEE